MTWDWLIENRIQQAMQEGAFKDLEGSGKPLKIETNPFIDREWRLAYHVMSSAGVAPAWIELDKEIRKRIQQARRQVSSAFQSGDEGSSMRAYARERFRIEVQAINRLIDDLNLSVPADHFARCRVNAELELRMLQSNQLDS
jgi:DnaJ family protein C protein 28